jgi:hypothetical protein
MHLKYGIFLFISYLFYEYAFKEQKVIKVQSILFGILLLIISPIIVACLSIYYSDIEQTIIALISLLIIIKIIFNDNISIKNKILLSLFAGGILGIAIGLKYSIASVAATILLSICIFNKSIRNWIKISLSYLLGIITGVLISDGWWLYIIYKKFHNPVFPFFNNIFASPMADKAAVLDFDFIYLRPHNIIDFISAPIRSTFSHLNGFEQLYYDIKMPIFAISIIILCLLFFKKEDIENKINEYIDFKTFKFLTIFIIIDYYLNLYIFGQYRYIIILYSLAPVIIAGICYLLSSGKRKYQYLFLSLIALTIAWHFLYDFKYQSMFGDMPKYYLYSSSVAILIIILIMIFLQKIKTSQNLFTVFLSCILICSICTYAMEQWFLNRNEMIKEKHVIFVKDMKIPDDSIVFLGTMKTTFLLPAQNKNVKYYGYVLPYILAKSGFWSNNLYNNKYYQNKYLENQIKENLLSDKKKYILLNSYELSDDFELYNKSLKKYTKNNLLGMKNCLEIDYEMFGLFGQFDGLTICEIK